MISTRTFQNDLQRGSSYGAAVASVLFISVCFPNTVAGQTGYGNESRYPTTMTCSSDDGSRVYCDADTRGGVRLVRRISGSECQQGSTWGYDSRGVWVDRGCRAEFEVAGVGSTSNAMRNGANTISCSSTDGQRVYCDMDTRGNVRLVREIGGSPCRQGSTWGYDSRGVWVDRGCKAEFEVSANSSNPQLTTIPAGTSISVRTSQRIDVRNNDGQVFRGVVDQDVMDASGRVSLPRGSMTELMVRNTSNQDLALDLESVTVNGQRYAIAASPERTADRQRDGIGSNRRTAEYVGGGALLGTIIGAIAGGGKGAAIGAAAGAGAGIGTQVLTRGKRVSVPAESLLTFRLEQPLDMGVVDNGVTRRGRHYHSQSR